MGNKIVSIVGSYHKGGVIDSAVTEILKGAESSGAKVEKYLYFGMVGERPEAGLDEKSLRRAFNAGKELARNLAE